MSQIPRCMGLFFLILSAAAVGAGPIEQQVERERVGNGLLRRTDNASLSELYRTNAAPGLIDPQSKVVETGGHEWLDADDTGDQAPGHTDFDRRR